MTTKIAIQGIKGSFHHQVVKEYFSENVDIDECLSFEELIDSLIAGKSDQAVMAIENSIAGSILPNYNLIQKSNLQVIGEVYLSISQNLMVHPGVQLKDIKEVHSHPMAILQCLDYLEQYDWKLVESDDTALSAKMVHQQKSKHIAAIASKLAAELFNLEILAPDIQTQKNNITRFLILQRTKEAQPIIGDYKCFIFFDYFNSKVILS